MESTQREIEAIKAMQADALTLTPLEWIALKEMSAGNYAYAAELLQEREEARHGEN